MVRPTASKEPTFKVGWQTFDRKEVLEGFKLLKSIDVSEIAQKKLKDLERDVRDCSSDVAYNAHKLQTDIDGLKNMELMTMDEHTSLTDQISHTTNEFKQKCLCFSKNIEGESFP